MYFLKSAGVDKIPGRKVNYYQSIYSLKRLKRHRFSMTISLMHVKRIICSKHSLTMFTTVRESVWIVLGLDMVSHI